QYDAARHERRRVDSLLTAHDRPPVQRGRPVVAPARPPARAGSPPRDGDGGRASPRAGAGGGRGARRAQPPRQPGPAPRQPAWSRCLYARGPKPPIDDAVHRPRSTSGFAVDTGEWKRPSPVGLQGAVSRAAEVAMALYDLTTLPGLVPCHVCLLACG